MQSVQSPIIPVVGELIRATTGTIPLGQGVVHYGPPTQAVEQIQTFLDNPRNHRYKLVWGIPQLREAIARKLRDDNDIILDSDREFFVTAGGNMAFVNAILAISNPGDEIIFNTPYYFNHEMAAGIASLRAVYVSTDESFQLRPDAILKAITDRTRAVVTISPNNPTGVVYSEESLRRVNEICRQSGVYHIHDEAYEYFVYDGATHFSPGAIETGRKHTISLFSLSKSYGFASWRIGYMVAPSELSDSLKKIQDTILICPPVISQFAACGALGAGAAYPRGKLSDITEVRRMVLDELATIGDLVTVPPADGAFYFLLEVNSDIAAMPLVERLIREHKVALIPGDTFGIEDGCHLRLAYAALEKETAAEGVGRLCRGLRAILG